MSWGLQKGLQEGKQEERRSIAKRLIAHATSVAEVAELTGLTIDEVEACRGD